MSKIDEFKEFAKTKPSLIKYVSDGKMTWQQFYEIYDLYGDSTDAWDKFNDDRGNLPNLKDIAGVLKKVDIDQLQKHINNAQKAIDVVSDLGITKKSTNVIKGPKGPRPITKFFED